MSEGTCKWIQVKHLLCPLYCSKPAVRGFFPGWSWCYPRDGIIWSIMFIQILVTLLYLLIYLSHADLQLACLHPFCYESYSACVPLCTCKLKGEGCWGFYRLINYYCLSSAVHWVNNKNLTWALHHTCMGKPWPNG